MTQDVCFLSRCYQIAPQHMDDFLRLPFFVCFYYCSRNFLCCAASRPFSTKLKIFFYSLSLLFLQNFQEIIQFWKSAKNSREWRRERQQQQCYLICIAKIKLMKDKRHFAVYIKTDDSSFAKILVKLYFHLRLLDKIQGAKHLICECKKKIRNQCSAKRKKKLSGA